MVDLNKIDGGSYREVQRKSLGLWWLTVIHFWPVLVIILTYVVLLYRLPPDWARAVQGGGSLLLCLVMLTQVIGFFRTQRKAKRDAYIDGWVEGRELMARLFFEHAHEGADRVQALYIEQEISKAAELGFALGLPPGYSSADGSHEDLP